jgi:hypothetical protein
MISRYRSRQARSARLCRPAVRAARRQPPGRPTSAPPLTSTVTNGLSPDPATNAGRRSLVQPAPRRPRASPGPAPATSRPRPSTVTSNICAAAPSAPATARSRRLQTAATTEGEEPGWVQDPPDRSLRGKGRASYRTRDAYSAVSALATSESSATLTCAIRVVDVLSLSTSTTCRTPWPVDPARYRP